MVGARGVLGTVDAVKLRILESLLSPCWLTALITREYLCPFSSYESNARYKRAGLSGLAKSSKISNCPFGFRLYTLKP